ncbi:MAG: type II toxin-antitoxin system HicB family antitoxin [Candidatus Latescibacter sp.]|nr:type II toxin-antitoxin system HicB family antitoxin [Candidatus Latescibacter sp.]
MIRNFTLEYWRDNGWYVGKLKEVPGVFSQGITLDELEENIKDVYSLMMEDEAEIPNAEIHLKEIARSECLDPETSSG